MIDKASKIKVEFSLKEVYERLLKLEGKVDLIVVNNSKTRRYFTWLAILIILTGVINIFIHLYFFLTR